MKNKHQHLIDAVNEIFYLHSNEKEEILSKTMFSRYLSKMSEEKHEMQKNDDMIYDKYWHSSNIMNYIGNIFYRFTGFNIDNEVSDYTKYCGNTGRKSKYDYDDKIFYCKTIEILIAKGASKTQAIKLLGHLTGEIKTSTTGFLNYFRRLYNEYENKIKYFDIDASGYNYIYQDSYTISKMLEFNGKQEFKSDEKSFYVAVNAFYSIWDDVQSLVKSNIKKVKDYECEEYLEKYKEFFNDINKSAIECFYNIDFVNVKNYTYREIENGVVTLEREIILSEEEKKREAIRTKQRNLMELLNTINVLENDYRK